MVDGFTDEKGKFRPIDRSAVPTKQLTVRELLPAKEKEEDKKRQSKRLGKFALKRAKEFGKGAKIAGELIVKGAKAEKQKSEERKQRKIEKSLSTVAFDEHLQEGIDDIIDEAGASDSRKFRRLQRFGIMNRNVLPKSDLRLLNATLKELDDRIQRDAEGKRKEPETGGLTQPQRVGTPMPPRIEGIGSEQRVGIPMATQTLPPRTEEITSEQFEKLPDELKEKIRVQVGG